MESHIHDPASEAALGTSLPEVFPPEPPPSSILPNPAAVAAHRSPPWPRYDSHQVAAMLIHALVKADAEA